MAWIQLPCFEGYTQFAAWPAQLGVSNIISIVVNFTVFNNLVFHCLSLQGPSCYGLLDTEMILHPVPTGDLVCIPYFPSYRYVAYKSEKRMQVLYSKS